ncbi:MAG TPA: PTS mannose/fructose/sorbose transporter subunit IIB [Caldithrix abyssi]|uniref:PTS mannose/fructose/sorbose transporter subunit IIB n=1 Tax=Caldithrix abyssi TaxID=187145 RepID=A0A7V5RMQ8_CALAY|nr:PTS mannose/fructose/sorbose transporter subunit IIB [Caldithrix abyssi]
MKIQLYRIDDRLIHGQVVIGWVSVLHSDKIILCDDEVEANDWEKELYLSCVPDGLKTLILDEKHAAELLNNSGGDDSKAIFLVKGPEVIEHLLDKGVSFHTVNVGGIHYKEGRRNFLPYLYLSDEEIASFHRCMKKGVRFECLDVPTGHKVDIREVIPT